MLQKDVKIDFQRMLKAVAGAAGHAAFGKWERLGDDAAEALYALGTKNEPGELASLLIKRAITKAVFDLIGDSAEHSLRPLDEPDLLIRKLDGLEASHSFDVDRRFLDRPAELPIVRVAANVFEGWLVGGGQNASSAQAIASRFPTFFVYALNQEWRRNAKIYHPIVSSIDTPFTKAGEREWAWRCYSALLRRRVEESVLDEPFSLQQIYMPLNCYYLDESKPDQSEEDSRRFGKVQRRVIVSVDQELRRWIGRSNPHDAIRVVSGGPGSGKSSFAKIFAANLAAQGTLKVLFAPLHLIDPLKGLEDEIGRFVRDEGILLQNPLDAESPEPNLLLILDGLDELATQGKAAAETARAFVREVERTVQKRNSTRANLRVLLSGRELVIQENELEFRQPGQVLTLLPYFGHSRSMGPDHVSDDVDPHGLLGQDLRHAWWQNYGRLTGRPFKGLPPELNREDLEDVTAQPLLNYLVALSLIRGKLDFSSNVNLNAIYSDLVAAVYERGYERRRAYASIRHMQPDDFVRVLEEIALAAWHGDGRSTTVREIEQHCEASGVGALLDKFKEGAQAGVTRLLAAFFFRQHGRRSTGDQTFVFTHKSFGEYLAARRVARAIRRLVRETKLRADNADEGWDPREALRHWALICGPNEMTQYLARFLFDEIMQLGADTARLWQKSLAGLFSYMLKHGLPLDGLHATNTRDALFRARNAEEALLVAMNACARVTQEVSDVSFDDPTAFGTWLRRIQGQRSSSESTLAYSCLSFLDLSGMALDLCDLYGANLSGSNLSRMEAYGASLMTANLRGADLSGARLTRADLEHCCLDAANLDNTILDGANLARASLHQVRFADLSLQGARLSGIQPEDVRIRLKSKMNEQHRSERVRVRARRKSASTA